jgi:hypothetical protein
MHSHPGVPHNNFSIENGGGDICKEYLLLNGKAAIINLSVTNRIGMFYKSISYCRLFAGAVNYYILIQL